MVQVKTTIQARKLTIAELGIDAEKVNGGHTENGQATVVAYFYGRTSAHKDAPSKFDPTKMDAKFVGTFEGVNAITGEVVNSKYAYLPGGAEDMVRDAVDALGDEGGEVEFAFEVSVRRDDKKPKKYVYLIATAREPKEVEALSSLREKLGVNLGDAVSSAPALPAPDATEETAPKSKGKKA
jgi:hypothetical protein